MSRGTTPPGLDALSADVRAVPEEGIPVSVADTPNPPDYDPAPSQPNRNPDGTFAPANEPEHVVETPAPEEDTPQVPQIDWEKRHNDLRSWSDRRYNELQAELERERARAAEQPQRREPVQPEYDSYDEYEDGQDFWSDPRTQQFLQEHAAMKQTLEAQQAEARQAEENARMSAHIDSELNAIEKALGREIPEAAANWIGNEAARNPDPYGNPDVEQAFATYRAILEAEKQAWVDTKRSAPAAPAAGPAPVTVHDTSTPKGRIALINERIANGG